jgi:hypothetical protein
MRWALLLISTILIFQLNFVACSKKEAAKVMEVKSYSADNLDGIISLSLVTIDKTDFTEGSASLKITTEKPQIIKLFETGDVEVENARIIYQAQLKCANLEGKAYLEMWCHFPGKGEFYSRALHSKISGDTGWSSHETIFTLTEKENPDNVKLNLVINGTGTVWMDNIRLLKVPLK